MKHHTIMAPSGGLKNVLLWKIAFLACSLLMPGGQSAQVAKGQYYMDNRDDCGFVGKLDVARDKTTFVNARSPSSPAAPQLSCTLQFGPQTRGDTIKMGFESGAYIANFDVSLNVQMSDNQVFQMTSQPGPQPPKLEARDGLLRIYLQRRSYASSDYAFRIWIRAERSVAGNDGSGSGSDLDVGVIVGIVAGVILLVVLFCVLCVCCYLRSKRADKVQGNANNQPSSQDSGMVKAPQNASPWANQESPASDRRLLVRNENTESLQGKSALERFGPVAPRKGRRGQDDYSDNDLEAGQPDRSRQQRSHQGEKEEGARRSPLLSDLHRNPKFRRSFHENEVDAHDRAKRVSYTSEESSVSVNSRGVPLPPKLPPVPKSPPRSPSPHRRGEKIAMVSRDRPLSSSSDLPRQLEENATPDELSDDEPRRPRKADTKHVLRPNRGERKSRRDEDDDSEEERRRRRREKERRDREREEEEEEEERRRRKREERRRREEEEEEERDRRRQRERDREDDGREREGRFKKSASGRKSKGKGPRKSRSRSTGNALEEMEDNYQRSRSKSPSSVRSLNFIEDDDDDDLDSNYMPFKRSGSKTSLYASRSSLYGRRRKNSMGETISLSSYMYDDADSRFGDFDKKGLSRREKDRMFKSTGELEMHTATAQVVRECATQTGVEKAVQIYGRKTIAKTRPGRMYSRGSQTGVGRDRRDSTGSARSGRSSRSHNRLKHKSRSQESLSKKGRRSRSRNLDDYSDDSDDRRSRKSRSRSRNLDYTDDDDDDESRRGGRRRNKHHRSKSRGLDDDDDDVYDDRSSRGGGRHKPRARPRKSTGGASVDLSDFDDGGSVAASSIAASMAHPPPPMQLNPYGGGQFVPMAAYPGGGPVAYLPTAPGGPPMVQVLPTAAPNGRPPIGPKPALAPKPQKSKWETLVEMTDGEKQRQRRHDSPSETESMLSSAYPGHDHGRLPSNGNVYAPPSYTTAQRYPNPNNSTLSSNYPDSSGLPHSARGPRDYKLDSYTPSESMI